MALTQVKSDGIADGAVTTDDLADSGVTAGTYGSSSAIPAITVDAKGRITSASTNSVTQVGGDNGVDFNDNVKARFGTGNDLEIYHDGTNSWIRNATGELYFSGANVKFLNYAQNETMLWGTQDGAVQFYHDNSAKLATTSSGIDVTGTVQCDGLTVDGTFKQSNGTGALVIQDDNNTGNGVVAYVQGVDSGSTQKWFVGYGASTNQDLYVSNSAGGQILFQSSGSTRITMQAAGHFVPASNNSIDLGTSSNRWRNVYTNDLNLSNEGHSNDVDGTWGSWTIQEGEDDLFLLNRRNGKKYKFNLTEVN